MWIYKSSLSHEAFTSSDSEYNKKYLAGLYGEYNELRDSPISELSLLSFKEYEKNGNRLGYEKPYFARRTMLRDFALMAWLGDDAAIEPLEKIISAICEEMTWALPAHIGGNEPYKVIDLFAAETAQTLTEIVSLLEDKLSTDLINRIIKEVRSRVLDPFINRTEKCNWETMKSNWCAVCGGSVGMAAIYLTEDTTELKRITESLKPIFESYMQSFSEDGACLEGLYYWGYGMTYLTAFLDLYKERTGWDFPINKEKLTKMADFAHKCCISDGITVSFSDGNERDRIYCGLSSKLGELYDAAPIPYEHRAYFLGDDCGRWCRAVRDIAWTRETKNTAPEKASILPDAQWAVIRGESVSVAFKGGSNGEPHNHNDIGSFIVVKDGKIILRDLGAGEYTKEYFSKDRYNIFTARSAGHSVPMINGCEQKTGARYAAADFHADENSMAADISGAYGIKELKKCVRKIELAGCRIILTDRFETEKPVRVTERFIVADGECIAFLKTDMECERKISEYEHREHDGTAAKVIAVDFIFNVKNNAEFVLKIGDTKTEESI